MTSTKQMFKVMSASNPQTDKKAKAQNSSSPTPNIEAQKTAMNAEKLADVMQHCLNINSSKKPILGR